MRIRLDYRGFTLMEVMVAVAIFVLFAIGVYGGTQFLYKVIYLSRMRILETSILSEELEIIRNLEFDDVGIQGGIPEGVIPRTRSIWRNGAEFIITATVRNYDDAFDGLATGTTPIDYSPADYKTVELSIICARCIQKEPVLASSVFSADGLEGMSNAGSLYVTVFDSQGEPVQGASVSIVNSSTDPFTVINDVTDAEGVLKIIGTPTGTLSYVIYVTKDGYTTDNTITSTVANPNPLKPPATVAKQEVTSISFAIDHPSSLLVRTMDNNCDAEGGANIWVYGTTRIGADPDVLLQDRIVGTDGGGSYLMNNLVWDDFFFSTTGTVYNLAGSIPVLPLNLPAGSAQEVSLILRPFENYSLLMTVLDQGTQLPLSDASVQLTAVGYNETQVTELGYARQTDWRGGAGQEIYTDDTRYWTDDGNIEVDPIFYDLLLNQTGSVYAASGWLESSTFNLGAEVDLFDVFWDPVVQNPLTGANPVRLQIATSNSSSPASWEFLGPDATADTFYTATNTIINDIHNGYRYMRYKVFLSTENINFSPRVAEIYFTYTNECAPPGQTYFSGLSVSTTYNYEVTRAGYNSATGTIDVVGNERRAVFMSVSE